MNTVNHYFGFEKEPFPQDIAIKDIYPHHDLPGLIDRFMFALDLCSISVITGEVGSGKSTSLRYAISKLHPSEYQIIQVIANRKSKPVLIIDEAHLLRLEVFAQIHILFEFELDSKPVVPVIFYGQKNLIDSLSYHKCRSIASRILGRCHLEGLVLEDMRGYLKHHFEIAGIKQQLFTDEAITAIHQGSGGLLRRSNYLAKGGLFAAFKQKCNQVNAEHVRIASTEII